ncbi:hypothetical protein J6590_025036 [Homalodisca vitripennis]|nr:hypothetical protein J6590_025036 [Homalodisca vitripennis]
MSLEITNNTTQHVSRTRVGRRLGRESMAALPVVFEVYGHYQQLHSYRIGSRTPRRFSGCSGNYYNSFVQSRPASPQLFYPLVIRFKLYDAVQRHEGTRPTRNT